MRLKRHILVVLTVVTWLALILQFRGHAPAEESTDAASHHSWGWRGEDAVLRLHCQVGAVPASIAQEELRIACVGDSITFGNGTHTEKHSQYLRGGNYPRELASLLSARFETDAFPVNRSVSGSAIEPSTWRKRNWVVVRNFGKGSTTVTNRSGKFSYRSTREFRKSLAFLPHIVVVMLGTNDSKDRHWKHATSFSEEYASLVNEYASLATHPTVVLLTPPPLCGSDRYHLRAGTIRDDVRPAVLKLRSRWHVVDIYQVLRKVPEMRACELRNSDNLFPAWKMILHDGVHPTQVGHRLIAHAILDSLCPTHSEPDLV